MINKKRTKVNEDQKLFRELVLKKNVNHWQLSNKLFFSSKNVISLIDCLKNYYKIPEPYATNIAHRFFGEAYGIIKKADYFK